jgi:hypothetical protein
MRKTRREVPPPSLRSVHAAGTSRAWTKGDRIRTPALRLQTLAGNDPRADAETNRKRGDAIIEQRRRSREWKRQNPNDAGHDRAWFLREVMPKLDDVPLSAIARVTGLSLAACSRYRAGARVPHPRHWEAISTLMRHERTT